MIRAHEANTAWWGRPVAIITDPAWFDLDDAARRATLESYAWAEFKAPLGSAPPAPRLARAGFLLSDVQVNFRLSLGDVPDSPSLAGFTCRSAAECSFDIGPNDLRAFEHERFLQLPGVTAGCLSRRYAGWAGDLLTRHPEWCLRLELQGETQGWFLSEPGGPGLHLTLAMLSSRATVSGHHLYHRALREYAERGASVGYAAFSVRNTAVLNTYSRLGARFLAPDGCWLWTPGLLHQP